MDWIWNSIPCETGNWIWIFNPFKVLDWMLDFLDWILDLIQPLDLALMILCCEDG